MRNLQQLTAPSQSKISLSTGEHSLDPAMSTPQNIQSPSSLATQILNQPPSCLEFCPDDPDYFIIGTYLLHEDKDDESARIKQIKTGSLQLWHLDAADHELYDTASTNWIVNEF